MARRLTAEEMELWRAVTANVRPRRPVTASPAPPRAIPDHHIPMAAAPASPLRPKQRGLSSFDARSLRNLRRERTEIDDRIDLHGMRAAEAHRAVQNFLTSAQQNGARIVLVVTGKGGEGAGVYDRGVLRRHTPIWFAQPTLADVVASYAPASPLHGGDGAFYVRLRRLGSDRRRR